MAEFNESWSLYDSVKHTSPINYVQETTRGDPAEVRKSRLREVVFWMNNLEKSSSIALVLATDKCEYALDLKGVDCDVTFSYIISDEIDWEQHATRAIIMAIGAGYSNMAMKIFASMKPKLDAVEEALALLLPHIKIVPGAYNHMMKQAIEANNVEFVRVCSLLK